MTADGQLAQLVQQGDLSAWEAIVQDHQEPIFRLAYLLLGDADDAEDVAQETFIRAFNSFHRFEPGRPLRPWLLRITANLTKNWHRSASRRLYNLQRAYQNEEPVADARHQAEQNLETQMMWEVIRKLKPLDQQMIHLRFFLKCTENEIAEVLEVAAGTVKSRLHRAINRLRVLLLELYPELLEQEQ